MRAYCFTCRDDTIVHTNGRCGFCDTEIASHHRPTGYPTGRHSYIGTEEFYRACYERYLELRSIRKVALEVWQQAGYASPASCWNVLHDAWRARGWPTFRKSYANTIHGKARRKQRDQEHRRALRVKRGDIRDVKCAGVRLTYPRKGEPCGMYALAGSDYCRYHDPRRRSEIQAETKRMRLARRT